MRSDIRRQVIIVAVTVITILVNGLANALPINGLTTGSISDRFAVLVVPAGYVFAIWGVIYVGLIAFAAHQARPSRRADPLLRRIGYLPALAGLLNTAWILLWHYQVFALTVPVMIGLLASLVAIVLTVRTAGTLDRGSRWLVRLPFSIYAGWITVATIANVAAFLASAGFDGLGIAPEAWAVAVLSVGISIAAAFTWIMRDVAYALVIVWAYIGVAVKEANIVPVAVIASVGALVITALLVIVVLSGRTRSHRPAPSPA